MRYFIIFLISIIRLKDPWFGKKRNLKKKDQSNFAI